MKQQGRVRSGSRRNRRNRRDRRGQKGTEGDRRGQKKKEEWGGEKGILVILLIKIIV